MDMKEVYSALEKVENGVELITAIKGEINSLNNEAKKHRLETPLPGVSRRCWKGWELQMATIRRTKRKRSRQRSTRSHRAARSRTKSPSRSQTSRHRSAKSRNSSQTNATPLLGLLREASRITITRAESNRNITKSHYIILNE